MATVGILAEISIFKPKFRYFGSRSSNLYEEVNHGSPNNNPKSPMSRLFDLSVVVVVLVVVETPHVALSSR